MVRKDDKAEDKIKKKSSRKRTSVRRERIKKETIKEEKVTKKENNNSFSNIEVYVIMIICLALGLVIGIFISGYRNENKEFKDSESEMVDLYKDIKDNYYKELDKDYYNRNINSMISNLNDPFSFYLEGLVATNYKEEQKNSFIGIGTEVQQLENGDIKFMTIFEDSPAKKVGIEVNDILTAVDGVSVKGKTLEETVKLIKGGKEDDKVKITVLRGEEEKTFTIKKKKIERDTVVVDYYEDGKIAVVYISKFADTTLEEAKKAFDEIKEKGYNNVAINVRDTSFGDIKVASDIASMFLDKGTVIYKEEIKDSVKEIKSTDDKLYVFNLKLLTTQYTTKAAEVLVSALNENANAEIIGYVTCGDSSIQKTRELENGNIVGFTIGKWLTSKGVDVSTDRIKPTYELEENGDYYQKLKEVYGSNNL